MATKDTGGGQQRSGRRTDQTDEVEVEVEESSASDLKERHEKLSEDVDSLLDEIDDVLEENAEEFVKGYVQKGGE
ncbi:MULTISPECIES: ubiquitin-like protein Pup [unclassified Frankia]|uniref:ubiquitin-like protein Pup n=1 Tax=unclassified Frankia TaxID=2632575 RepID=UPI002AD2278B|nr:MULTISPECIES: ubiquitin-like protein Pup [unclassified Frankia]